MLIATFLSNFIQLNLIVVGNTLGYSLLSNIIMYFTFDNKRYCWLVRNIPTSLIIINLIDMSSYFISYSAYSILFNIAVCVITITMAIIFKLKEKK